MSAAPINATLDCEGKMSKTPIYKFSSIGEMADFFDELAERLVDRSIIAKTRRHSVELMAEAYGLRQASEIVRLSIIASDETAA